MSAQLDINTESLLEAAQLAVQDADRIADLNEQVAGDPAAEAVLQELASVFFESTASYSYGGDGPDVKTRQFAETPLPNLEASTAPWLSRFPLSSSWPTWTKELARLM